MQKILSGKIDASLVWTFSSMLGSLYSIQDYRPCLLCLSGPSACSVRQYLMRHVQYRNTGPKTHTYLLNLAESTRQKINIGEHSIVDSVLYSVCVWWPSWHYEASCRRKTERKTRKLPLDIWVKFTVFKHSRLWTKQPVEELSISYWLGNNLTRKFRIPGTKPTTFVYRSQ